LGLLEKLVHYKVYWSIWTQRYGPCFRFEEVVQGQVQGSACTQGVENVGSHDGWELAS